MSATSRWSYTNVATIWPEGERDPVTRQPTWGEPFTIACTFDSASKMGSAGVTSVDENGEAFVPRFTVYHEDQRATPIGSRIVLGQDMTGQEPPSNAETIRNWGIYDMSFFGEDPDFVIWT